MAVSSVQDFKISRPESKPALQGLRPADISVEKKHDVNYAVYSAGGVLGGGSGVLLSGLKKDFSVNSKFANFAKNEIKKIMVSNEAPKIFEELETIEPSEYLPTYKSIVKNNKRLKEYLAIHPDDTAVGNSQKRIEESLEVFERQINRIKEEFRHLNKTSSVKRGMKFGLVAMIVGLGVSGMVERVLHAKNSKNNLK